MKFKLFINAERNSFITACWIAGVLQLGSLAGSAQTNKYLFTGSETNITLSPGLYYIAAYGARGGYAGGLGAEMEGEFRFTTTTTLTLLVGGSGGGNPYPGAGGGGGGSFVVNDTTPLVVAGGGGGNAILTGGGKVGNIGPNGSGGGGGLFNPGGSGGSNGSGGGGNTNSGGGGGGGGFYGGGGSGSGGSVGGGSSFFAGGGGGSGANSGGYGGGGGGAQNANGGGGGGGYSGGGGGGGYYGGPNGGGGGGSIIDSSAIAVLAEVSGVASPDGSPNGEIIITVVPKPIVLASASTAGGNFGFNITGPTNATIVIEACTNLTNSAWIPMATNLLSNGTNYFSDTQWTNYPYRFYRVSEP